VASLHASWSEWKNLFSMEIYGRDGKLEISGLGGSYGVERVTFYRMTAEMGPPEATTWEYPMADDSWEVDRRVSEDIRADASRALTAGRLRRAGTGRADLPESQS
jgi:hypothetical protein